MIFENDICYFDVMSQTVLLQAILLASLGIAPNRLFVCTDPDKQAVCILAASLLCFHLHYPCADVTICSMQV